MLRGELPYWEGEAADLLMASCQVKNTHKYTVLSLAKKVCTFLAERSENRRFSIRHILHPPCKAQLKPRTYNDLLQWIIMQMQVYADITYQER